MNNTRKEKISAFLDNHVHPDELMSFSLSAEDDDSRIAQRYQMIGDAMRGELSDSSFVDISVAVREALSGENIAGQMPAESIRSSQPSEQSRGFDLMAWFRPVAGLAVAASVAVVMVVTLSTETDSGLSAPVAQNNSATPATTVAGSKAVVIPVAEKNTATREFNPYINQHLEYATQDPLQGRLPYVRAVSYESNQTH